MDKVYLLSLLEQLKASGYKITEPRNAVLETLLEFPNNHFSSEEIYAIIKRSNPKIGLATVYRTLTLLENIGIISKLDLNDGFSRYELHKPAEKHSHHHLICSSCGNIAEVEDDLLDCLEEQILLKNKFLVQDHRVVFYGLCEKCRT